LLVSTCSCTRPFCSCYCQCSRPRCRPFFFKTPRSGPSHPSSLTRSHSLP
jgi:hypothetical protein